MLSATVLIDNKSDGGYVSEWGFSVYISYKGKNYLLDTGASDKYAKNAAKLGIKLEDVDTAVLSHAHFDHSGGFHSFFSENKKARLYVSANCGENCFRKIGPFYKYIGVPRKMLNSNTDRIEYVSGFKQLDEGVWLVPHIENGLEKIGGKAKLYRRENGKTAADNFCHEQSLVFETEKGLAVFNSCSHGGLQNILADIEHFLPARRVYMTVGGLHLSKYSDSDVRAIADVIKKLGIGRIVTGHCTGKAYKVLREELGDAVEQTRSGMKIEL